MTREDYDIEVAKEYTTLQERIATLEKENKVLAQNLEDTEILNKTYEKRFSDLEKENAELKNKLEHRNCLDCSNHSSNLRMRNLELEKENAELKGIKDVATLIRANNDTVVTLMQLNNKLVSKNQQLTKAKEIIREFVEWATWQGNSKCPSFKSIQDKAEAFLNSEVEK